MERISEDGTTETSDSEYPDKLLTGNFSFYFTLNLKAGYSAYTMTSYNTNDQW